MNGLDWVNRNAIGLYLQPALLSEILGISVAQADIFVYEDGLFQPFVRKGESVSVERIKDLLTIGHREAFVQDVDYQQIRQKIARDLTKITRGLSIGDSLENGRQQLNLLSQNMKGLYEDPLNTDLLTLQFQSTLTLSKFLLDNKKIHPSLFLDTEKKDLPFPIKDPLMSSILLLGFMQYTHLFHPKEMELLFITSYFKDLGISFVDQQLVEDEADLPDDQRLLFNQHTAYSKNILSGRTPLNRSHLQIIENHHYMDPIISAALAGEKFQPQDKQVLQGIETMMVTIMDVIVAMGRKDNSLFSTLEILKGTMSEKHPSEFKALVHFLKAFFSKAQN